MEDLETLLALTERGDIAALCDLLRDLDGAAEANVALSALASGVPAATVVAELQHEVRRRVLERYGE